MLERLVAGETFRGNLARVYGCTYCAAGFVFVLAVAEAAALRRLLDVRERGTDARIGIPQPQPTHARHVNHVAAAGHGDHLAAYRGVTTLAVALAHAARFLHFFANKHVDQARLAHTGLTDKHGSSTCGHKGAHGFHALRIAVGHHQRAHVRARQRAHAGGNLLHLRLAFGQVSFCEHHSYRRAGFVCQH